MTSGRYLSAKEVAETLHVSIATVYAYVSRGLLRSEATGGKTRERRYLYEDVEKLLEQKGVRNDPGRLAQNAMHWGAPILESALTNITQTDLLYRGRRVADLALQHSVEEVAALLWTGNMQESAQLYRPHIQVRRYQQQLQGLDTELTPLQKLQIALTLASSDDLAAYDLQHKAVPTGANILTIMAAIIANVERASATLVETLQKGWELDGEEQRRLLNATLVLCADHELNPSSFAARVVASAETHLYAVVSAGLSALQGFRHGGATMLVEGLLRESNRPNLARKVITERLRRGESIPGFGHKLYPQGDPRAALLLRMLDEAYPHSPTLQLASSISQTIEEIDHIQPNIDFALVILSHTLKLADGSALALLALGRTIGWIGHAIEQYQSGEMMRPRASYVGL